MIWWPTEDSNRPVKRKRALLESNPPRNIWLKLIKTMPRASDETVGARWNNKQHRIDRFAMPQKLTFYLCEMLPDEPYFFFLFSNVRLNRNDSVPVSMM